MVPAKGGGARPEPERALTRRVKANVFAQDKPRQGQSKILSAGHGDLRGSLSEEFGDLFCGAAGGAGDA